MWMSFTLTSRRHPNYKCLAQGPQELKPALSWPITSASSNWKLFREGNSLTLLWLQQTSTSQSDCRDVSWMDTGGNNPRTGHWMPPPNYMLLSPFSCWHQCDFRSLVAQLGRMDFPRMGRGKQQPSFGHWWVPHLSDMAVRLQPLYFHAQTHWLCWEFIIAS